MDELRTIQPAQPVDPQEEIWEDSSRAHHNQDQDLHLIDVLNNARSPIFLGFSRKYQTKVAVKMFKHVCDRPSKAYLNEVRFSNLCHPNVIKILGSEDSIPAVLQDKLYNVSYLVMELALCDLTDLITEINSRQDEKLVRTLFHQLIDGLEYLHSQDIAHLDIKMDNLLFGQDFELKITDFDFSYKKGDVCSIGRGTPGYRAPEIAHKKCKEPKLADLYSAGIILFVLRFGYLPYDEKDLVFGCNLQELMFQNPERFFQVHQKFRKANLDCCEEFKQLFLGMINEIPEKRLSINEIRRSSWYQGQTYKNQEMKSIFNNIFMNNM